MPRSDTHTRVLLQWHAVPNANKQAGGWLPVYDLDGKQRGDTYGSRGFDLETALQMAQAEAEDEAARYVGDWDVVVEQKPGSPGAVKTRRAPKAAKARATARPSPWGGAGSASDALPWRNSYANWSIRVGEAAARHGATIAFGPETYDAWQAGTSPDAYAKARARR